MHDPTGCCQLDLDRFPDRKFQSTHFQITQRPNRSPFPPPSIQMDDSDGSLRIDFWTTPTPSTLARDPRTRPLNPPSPTREGRPMAVVEEAATRKATTAASSSTLRTTSMQPALATDPWSRPLKRPSPSWERRPMVVATEASKWKATTATSASTLRTTST